MIENKGLPELLEDQDRLVTRGQLRELGVSRGQVRWALSHGWRCVLPSVVLAGSGELTERQRLVAARLHAGPQSVLASFTAATWHGVSAAADPRVHVMVPVSCNPRSEGFVTVVRTRRPDARPWHRGPLVVASRARAVVDAARAASHPDQASAILCEAVERRLVTASALRHELEAGVVPGGARVRRALREIEAGAWSVPEADLYRLVAGSAALTPLWLNPTLAAADGLRLPTPDGWFDAVGLAVQVHSWRWHSSMADWDGTVMQDGVFAEYGVPVVGVTPQALRRTPERLLGRLERAHAQAAGRPRAAVTAVPQAVRRRPRVGGSGLHQRGEGRQAGFGGT